MSRHGSETSPWSRASASRPGELKLAIDVFTDDPDDGEFRLRLTSRKKRRFFRDTVGDTPELEDLRTLVHPPDLDRRPECPLQFAHDENDWPRRAKAP